MAEKEVFMTTEEENLKGQIKYLKEVIEFKKQSDLFIVIDSPIEDFGIDRCQQLEQHLDKALVPLGLCRTGSGKLENQTLIFFRQFAETL